MNRTLEELNQLCEFAERSWQDACREETIWRERAEREWRQLRELETEYQALKERQLSALNEFVLEDLVEQGWRSAKNPPNTDRTVEIATSDGDWGPNLLGFYDTVSSVPQRDEAFWWTHPKMTQLPKEHVIAWREKQVD